MCNNKMNELCCPITFWMCEEADRYCLAEPGGQRVEGECCGQRGEPCCIDCFYCLSPLAMVLDVILSPCTMYDLCLECQQKKQKRREEKERRAFGI